VVIPFLASIWLSYGWRSLGNEMGWSRKTQARPLVHNTGNLMITMRYCHEKEGDTTMEARSSSSSGGFIMKMWISHLKCNKLIVISRANYFFLSRRGFTTFVVKGKFSWRWRKKVEHGRKLQNQLCYWCLPSHHFAITIPCMSKMIMMKRDSTKCFSFSHVAFHKLRTFLQSTPTKPNHSHPLFDGSRLQD